MKKYELTDETMEYDGHILHRIRALRDFNDVKKGDLGGWIAGENNLDQIGNAWVYDSAKVYDGAKIYSNATVRDNAIVYENAMIGDNATIFGCAHVYNNALIGYNASVYDSARICGHVMIYGNAVIRGYAVVNGDAAISGDAYILCESDYICIKGLGSQCRVTVAYRTKTNGIAVKCGCFCGDLSEFKKKIKATHGRNKYAKEYLVLIKVIKAHFKIS